MPSTLRNPTFRHLFAAQIVALLGTGPLTGWIGAGAGLSVASLALAAIDAVWVAGVLRLWPANDQPIVPHAHPALPPDHPYLAEHGTVHAHTLVVDDLHRTWPRTA